MQTPMMRYRANACGIDALSCKRLWGCCAIMQTPVGLMRYHANACVTVQTPVGLMCYRANACGLDVLSCKRLWA